MTRLRLMIDASLRLADIYGTHQWFYVRKRQATGYLLEPFDCKDERRFHSDEILVEHYIHDRMLYRPTNESHMSEVRNERLRQSWAGIPKAKQLVAERREAVVKEIKKQIRSGRPMCEVFEQVPDAVVIQYSEQWAKEDYAIAYKKFEDEKTAGVKHAAGAEPKPARPFTTPCARTAWEWTFRYIEMGNNVLALVRYDDKKGRRNQLDPKVAEAMHDFINDLKESKLLRQSDSSIYVKFKKRLEGLGLLPPSRVTFVKHLRAGISGYDVIAARRGKAAADQSRDISEYVPDPDWALAQVEIDHTLANIHLICDITGAVLGRVWITVVLDRLTRIILGCHISFLAPSWATLSRAIAHAIWVKDLSHFPGLAGRWDHHGVFDTAYTDRGMDFISHAARRAGTFVGFDMANLPGRSPWLKGKVERCFRTIGLQCYDYEEGLTSFKDPNYNARKNANIFVSQFKSDFISWIIDYNHREHSAHAGQRSPDNIWQDSVDSMGGVRPVPNVSTLRRMMGESAYPMISNDGMKVLGLHYTHPRMEELRTEYNIQGRRFEARYDPYNLAAIDFFDGNDWHVAYCRRPDIADGVTRWQHQFHLNMAAAGAKNGLITADAVAAIKAQAQTDFDLLRHQLGKSKLRTNGNRLASYLDQGQFLTPLRFISDRPKIIPLQIPGTSLLEDGRFLVPPRPNFQLEAPQQPLMLPALEIVPEAQKQVAKQASNANKNSKPAAVAPPGSSDRMRARLDERRQSRDAR